MLMDLSAGGILMLAAGSVLFKIMLGYNFKVLISFFDIELVLRQWFGLTCIASMANYILPAKAGTAAQAVYLKKEYGFKYSNFLSSITGFYAVTFLVNSVAGMVLSGYLFFSGRSVGSDIFIFFAAALVVTAIFLIMIYHFPKLTTRFSFIQGFFDGLKNFHNKPDRALFLVISQVGVILAIGIRLLIAFRVLGIGIDLVSCMVIALITSFSIFISLTPGNLGIKELLITFSSSILGVSPGQALMVAIVDRSMDIVISFASGYVFTYVLAVKKNNAEDDRV